MSLVGHNIIVSSSQFHTCYSICSEDHFSFRLVSSYTLRNVAFAGRCNTRSMYQKRWAGLRFPVKRVTDCPPCSRLAFAWKYHQACRFLKYHHLASLSCFINMFHWIFYHLMINFIWPKQMSLLFCILQGFEIKMKTVKYKKCITCSKFWKV